MLTYHSFLGKKLQCHLPLMMPGNHLQWLWHVGMDSRAQLSILDSYQKALGIVLAADQRLTHSASQGQ